MAMTVIEGPTGMTGDRAEDIQGMLARVGYVADRPLALALTLQEILDRPLLLEGDAGVGKTAVAQALADGLNCRLIRLQCYEGLDTNTAVYEWNYQHQLMTIRLQESAGRPADQLEQDIFAERFLLRRPLLEAISQPEPPILLIDEIDRADEEFEAFLLEVLSDYQITIPELGSVKARSIPRVVLTSNGMRDLSDALRRRCLYFFLDYPSPQREREIVAARLPGVGPRLAGQVVAFVQTLRGMELRKVPGIAETLDWAAALAGMGIDDLLAARERVPDTFVCLIKTQEDRHRLGAETVDRLLEAARAGAEV
jgi:MoxR-like ATPase